MCCGQVRHVAFVGDSPDEILMFPIGKMCIIREEQNVCVCVCVSACVLCFVCVCVCVCTHARDVR